MRLWHLTPENVYSLTALPETGMGFQLVEASALGSLRPFLVLNSKYAMDLSPLGLSISDDPSVILSNGLSIVAALNDGVAETLFAEPGLRSFRLLSARIPSGRPSAPSEQATLHAAMPSSLIKRTTLTAARRFHRFSAFHPDNRVDPTTGSLRPGTYATTTAELPLAPTGFAAVGRFALPNSDPASFHYQVDAPSGTPVHFGTVAPSFGQAGGGVEAYFPSGVINVCVPPLPVQSLPDD